MPKISIIVPVYKVEKFLNKCLDSILSQTFADFDLILVDDGSPDNSGKICDEYAAKDDRIVVLHKENGGQSSARNVGLDWAFQNSDSEYIYFADADDYIDKDLLSITFSEIIKQNADIVCFGITMVDEDFNELSWGTMNIKKDAVLGYGARFKPIIGKNSFGDYPVNKLYMKELLRDIRFPEGLVYEDVYVTYKIFDKAKKIVLLKQNLYFYVRHSGSTTRSEDNGVDTRIYNLFYACEEKYKHISAVNPKSAPEAIEGVSTSLFLCVRSIRAQKHLADFSKDIEFFRNKAKAYWSIIKKSKCVKVDYKKSIKCFIKSYESCERYLNKKKREPRLMPYVVAIFKRVFRKK